MNIMNTRIIIQEPLNHLAQKIYQGSQSRYPTMTDVKFIDHNRIVCAHRYGCKVYHIQLDDTAHTFLDKLTVTRHGQMTQTEMLDIHDTTIYLICYDQWMCIIDILHNSCLQIRKWILLTPHPATHHGIRVHGEHVYITPSKSATNRTNIVRFHMITEQITYLPCLGQNLRIKNIVFLDNGLIVMVVNFNTRTSMLQPNHISTGAVQLYSSKFRLIQSIPAPNIHFDSICAEANRFYATGADTHSSYIYRGIIQNNVITEIKYITSPAPFPHGIDIRGSTLAFTSYGESSVHVIDISLLKFD